MRKPHICTTRPALAAVSLAIGLLASGLPGLASAQSLQALYEAARSYDATYLAARAQAESAEFRAAQAEALARPSLAVTAGASTSRNNAPGGRNANIDNVQASLRGSYALFNRVDGVTIEQARKSLVAAQALLDSAEQDLIVRLAQAYFDVLAAQDALETARASKTAIAEQLASAKRNFEVGTATITDAREAQAFFDLATAREIAAANNLLASRIALDQRVGRTDVQPWPLLVPVVLPRTVPANPEEWVSLADAQHPSVRQARVALEVAQLETSKARAGALPTVEATAELGPSYSRGSGAFPRAGTNSGASVGVQMSWPLYTGGATQNRVKETLSLEDKARNDLEAARRGVAQATRVAWFTVESLQAQVKALEAAEASSKLALEATELGYRVGVRVNLDVLNAQTQLFTTRRDLARARYDVLLGGLVLRQAAGQLAPSDVQTLDTLLAR